MLNFQFQLTMPLFGKSQKSPAEVVKALKDAVNALEKGEKKGEKGDKKVGTYFFFYFAK